MASDRNMRPLFYGLLLSSLLICQSSWAVSVEPVGIAEPAAILACRGKNVLQDLESVAGKSVSDLLLTDSFGIGDISRNDGKRLEYTHFRQLENKVR